MTVCFFHELERDLSRYITPVLLESQFFYVFLVNELMDFVQLSPQGPRLVEHISPHCRSPQTTWPRM